MVISKTIRPYGSHNLLVVKWMFWSSSKNSNTYIFLFYFLKYIGTTSFSLSFMYMYPLMTNTLRNEPLSICTQYSTFSVTGADQGGGGESWELGVREPYFDKILPVSLPIDYSVSLFIITLHKCRNIYANGPYIFIFNEIVCYTYVRS